MQNSPCVEFRNVGEVGIQDAVRDEYELFVKDLVQDIVAHPVLISQCKNRWVHRLYLGITLLVELLNNMPQYGGFLFFTIDSAIPFRGDHHCIEFYKILVNDVDVPRLIQVILVLGYNGYQYTSYGFKWDVFFHFGNVLSYDNFLDYK